MNFEERIISMLEALTGNVLQMQGDIKQMQGDIKQMQGDITQLQRDVIQMQRDIAQNQNSIMEMKSDIKELKHGQARLESGLKEVRNATVKIEYEHGKKLDALFDGYSQMYDISKGIRTNFAAIQSIQDKQELYIKWLTSQNTAE